MTRPYLTLDPGWDPILAQCRSELARLPLSERAWLHDRLSAIGHYQHQLDQLFQLANGPAACTSCSGGCCDRGRHHFTLTNLLGYLLQDLEPPRPDYDQPCPFLGRTGCLLDLAMRPFNCVTFLCEAVAAGLAPADQASFDQIEKRLRAEYEAVAARYAGASLRGLIITLERLDGSSLLQIRAGRE